MKKRRKSVILSSPEVFHLNCIYKQDRNLWEVLIDYKAPIQPKKLVTNKETQSELIDDNKNEDEILEGDAAEEANLRYKKKLEIYKKNLLPICFQDEKIMIYPEDVQPNCILVAEKYQHVLAAAIYELRDRIQSNILIHNKNNPTKKIVPGIPHLTYIKCFYGCDGFGNLKLISEHCQRTLPDHGLGYDMSISEIWMKPCEEEPMTVPNFVIAKTTGKQRLALTDDLCMVLDIGDNYLLNIDFSIQSSMVDMKYRQAMWRYKKWNPSFGCFLCTKPSKEWTNIDLILSGFKIDRHHEEKNNWQNIIE